jgi:AcrR family transcriptional regulator
MSESRRRALWAMARAVEELGYPETTVRDVLERARMSRRTFYELFQNREECFLAAYDAALLDALDRIEEACERDGSAAPHVDEPLRELLAYLTDRPELARLLVVEPVRAGTSGLERHERTMRELAWRVVRAQPSSAREHERVMLRAEAGVGAVHRIVQARIVDGRAGELEGLAPELSRVMRELALEA